MTLRDLRFIDRTARAVDGVLEGVVVPDVGGRELTLDSIRLAGAGETVIATTTIPGAEVEGLIADGIEAKLGARPTSVTLTAPDRLTVELAAPVKGRFDVSPAGDLAVRITNGPAEGQVVTLLRGGDDMPIRLTDASVTRRRRPRAHRRPAVGLLG